jgi:hypothetical protein
MVRRLAGDNLEHAGLTLLNEGFAFGAIRPEKETVRLIDLDPEGPHGPGDSLELDYLLPLGRVCLVGEITARTRTQDLDEKYRRFRD